MARVKTVFKLFAPILLSGGLLSTVSVASPVHIEAIKPFPNARLDTERNEGVTSYPIVSSSMKKVNGVVLADNQQWLDGYLSRRLYQLPSGTSSEQAFQFFTDQFNALGVEELFSCERFSCGGSNFWANDVFNIAKLYGLDREQAYFIGHKTSAGENIYYLTYTVKRGNRREYALVDVFTVRRGNGSVLAAGDTETITLDQLPQTEAAIKMSELSDKIKSLDPSSDWLVTLHAAAATSLAGIDSKNKALAKAESALKAYLVQQGFDSSRFRVQSVITQGNTASITFTELRP